MWGREKGEKWEPKVDSSGIICIWNRWAKNMRCCWRVSTPGKHKWYYSGTEKGESKNFIQICPIQNSATEGVCSVIELLEVVHRLFANIEKEMLLMELRANRHLDISPTRKIKSLIK